MIVNYGYMNGSGEFFISIDTDKCAGCSDKLCVVNCPEGILEIFIDDFENEIVGVKEEHRNKIKYSCGPCKTPSGERELACQKLCPFDAIQHSW